VADAEELPFADASFDCVASVFGAVFAPRPEVVAAELFRVVRPGNTVGLTAWGRYGPQAEIFEVSRSFSPAPPDDVPLPHLWGDEEIARERLAPHAATIEAERKTMRWQVESPDAAFTLFANNGPGKALSQALSPERVAEWKAALLEVIARHNLADDGSVVYEPEYLQVVARRRG
jgi:SAM-dependent methyltransferase